MAQWHQDIGEAPGPAAATSLDEAVVREALAEVRYPGLGRDLVSFDMVRRVAVCGTDVKVDLSLRSDDPTIPGRLREAVAARLATLGARSITVLISAPEAVAAPAMRGAPDPWADQVRLASVRHVVAVGAGKGGVGKSTVAVNLGIALARGGLRVGLLDADIYGPSLPILLGIEDGASRIRMTPEKHILPLLAHGLPLVSFGFFLGERSPAIWRGPMVSKAVKQFVRGVAWPSLDVLVVDLPPGTGDVPLSLAQSVALSGGVVVMQPPRVAAVEARKAAEMFRSLDVPVLGIVENMTGAFGAGAGDRVASELGVELLGAIPFDPRMVADGDEGMPTVSGRPASAASACFEHIARRVAASLGWRFAESVHNGSDSQVAPGVENAI